MRILVLNQYFHPDAASSGQLLTELCEDLASNHEVWVVCGRPSYNVRTEGGRGRRAPSRQKYAGVEIRRVRSTQFARSRMAGRIINYLSYLSAALIAGLRARRPDVVMTWTDPPPIALAGAVVARFHRAPFVLSSQDIVPESVVVAGELHNRFLIGALRATRRFAERSATEIVSIGDEMTRRLEESGVPVRKITTIRNWADGDVIRPTDGARFREEHSWNGRFVLMHSGNIGFSQDLGTLLDAAEILRSTADVVIAIVGEGASKPKLVEEVRGRGLRNVEFLPFQPKELLPESLGAADVHLVSHKKGLIGYQVPSKIYGILAAGKPFIAAVEKDSEAAAIIDEYGCGFRVDPANPSELAQAVLRMRDSPLDEMGTRARRAFDERYSRERATSAYNELLERAAAQR